MNKSEIILYTTEDGQIKLKVKMLDETVWLSQAQIGQLFSKSKATISEHIANIFDEGELDKNSVVRNFRTTASDGKSYSINHYNLDVIISVGYRVRSHRGTQFRIWATERLREYIIKGFTINDDLLKQAGGGDYFDELLARIRDIRSSEKVFYKKILDIYATSVDYDPKTQQSKEFFASVQNKMHWAAHQHTAAEIIYTRADAQKPNMGITTLDTHKIKKSDTKTAKNYLTEQELDILNRQVTAFLEFAELQALRRNQMTMQDWVDYLNNFLQLTGSPVLENAGSISNEHALEKAAQEYEKFNQNRINETSQVETHFIESIDQIQKKISDKNQ
jgi:hypothetical protein